MGDILNWISRHHLLVAFIFNTTCFLLLIISTFYLMQFLLQILQSEGCHRSILIVLFRFQPDASGLVC